MTKPENFSTYNKNQVILTSGRLVFNAREDSLFLLSKKDLAISTGGDVHINVGLPGSKSSIFIVNSNRIQFGLESKGRVAEPVAKANSLLESLQKLSGALTTFTKSLSKVTGTVEAAALLVVATSASALQGQVESFNKSLNKIPSKTTFSI